jgi:hypothetical protein
MELMMHQVIHLENPITKETWVCDDFRPAKIIEGVEYILVRKQNQSRTVLMRKDTFKKLKK